MSGRPLGKVFGLLSRALLVSTLVFTPAAYPEVLDTCTFVPSGPVLQPNAHPHQTLKSSLHGTVETVSPRPGLVIEIRQDGCQNIIGTRLLLTAARDPERKRSDDE